MATPAAAYTALVVGSTGAVGRELVAELVASAKCAKVIALARRDIPREQWAKSFPRLDADAATSKLEIRAVDFDTLSERDIKAEDQIDAAFCCLGTTRKDAGSAEAFRKVDLEYVTRFGELSKKANAPYFGLLSAANVNKSSWFLYPQTKGEADENIKTLDFPRTSFFRPGLINRGELARTIEKIGMAVLPSVTTVAIAKGMLADYESGSSDKLTEIDNAQLKKFHLATKGGAKLDHDDFLTLLERFNAEKVGWAISFAIMPSTTVISIAKGMVVDFESGSSDKVKEIHRTELKRFEWSSRRWRREQHGLNARMSAGSGTERVDCTLSFG